MKTALFLLVCACAPTFLPAQSGFAETYDATAGFDGKFIENTAYGYRVFADKTTPDPNTFTRMIFETGADGAFWGVTANTPYPLPAGTLIDLAPNGDYVTAETVTTPTGMALRIRRWFPNLPGYFNNLAEINFPGAAQLVLERIALHDGAIGGVFLAGHYRTLAEPGIPVPFLVRSSNSAFDWWIHTLSDIPPGSFAFLRLTAFSDGGCALAFKKNDETKFIERFDALGASRWRRQAGWLTTTISSLTEGPGGVAFYTLINAPFQGPAPTHGNAVAVAPDNSLVFDRDLNAMLGQYSVFPQYLLPLAGGGSVLAGFESPFPGAGNSFFIARLDAAGQLIWKKNYYFFKNGASFGFGRTTPDNGYIFTGNADGRVFLFKIDHQGAGGNQVQYCPAQAAEPWHEWIAGVQIGSIQNASGKTPYSNFTALGTDLGIGEPVDITLTAGFSYTTYDQYFGVWIDYNRDNVFGGDEMAVAAVLPRPHDGTPAESLTANFSVPASALPGPTRMRVVMQREAFSGPCSDPTFGEVEDYTVNLKISGPAPELTTAAWELIPANNSCFTNPGQAYGFLGGLVFNFGAAGAGPFTAKAWLSPDDQLGNAGDILWQTVLYDTLGPNGAAGNPVSLNIDEPVPLAALPGLYHLFVQVDADNALTEPDESNNLLHGTAIIGAPDYFLQNLSGVPATLATGAQLNFSLEINHSNIFPLAGLPGGVELSVYLSPDNLPNNGNELLLGIQTLDFDAFDAAGVAAKTLSLQLPGIVTAGSYFLILQVRPTAYCDQNYQNNFLVGPEILIVGQPSGAYCGAQGEFPWHDWIAGVSVANLANGSGKSTYSDFSALTADLVANTNAPVALTAGFSWTGFDEYWKIWIDFDHDGTFDGPDELAFQEYLLKPADGTPNATVNGLIFVPSSALPGATRMRVAMKRSAWPGAEPCETFAFGEVEDYTVNILPSFQGAGARAVAGWPAAAFNLYPNPAGAEVFLTTPKDAGIVAVKIFDQNGRAIREMSFEKTDQNLLAIPLGGFNSGLFWLQIVPENGQVLSKKLVVLH